MRSDSNDSQEQFPRSHRKVIILFFCMDLTVRNNACGMLDTDAKQCAENDWHGCKPMMEKCILSEFKIFINFKSICRTEYEQIFRNYKQIFGNNNYKICNCSLKKIPTEKLIGEVRIQFIILCYLSDSSGKFMKDYSELINKIKIGVYADPINRYNFFF